MASGSLPLLAARGGRARQPVGGAHSTRRVANGSLLAGRTSEPDYLICVLAAQLRGIQQMACMGLLDIQGMSADVGSRE